MPKTENIIVMCCFCGEGLNFEKAIQISILIESDSEASQGLFSHKECLDNVLNKNIPRGFDLDELDN